MHKRLQFTLRIVSCFLSVILLLNLGIIAVTAQDTAGSDDADAMHELVLVLDISGSMQDYDSDFLAPDCLKQLTESLPVGWRTGLVTYNDQVAQSVGITEQTASIHNTLSQVAYNGYTNTSTGINKAMSLFNENALSRQILLLTDGEILLESETDTLSAAVEMDTALQNAVSAGIMIHTVGLGNDFQSYNNSIKRSSEATGGRLFEIPEAEGLSAAVTSLLYENLGVRKISVGSAQMSGSNGSYRMELPVAGLTQAKILITSESPVSNVAVSCEGSEILQIVPGKRFAAVTIDNPASRDITVSFTSSGASTATMIVSSGQPELHVNVDYRDTKVKVSETAEESSLTQLYEYERTALLTIQLLVINGDNFFQSFDLKDSTIALNIDGNLTEESVTDGSLRYELPITEPYELSASVSLDWLPFNLAENTAAANVQLEGPPESVRETTAVPAEKPAPIPIWILLVTVGALIFVVAILILVFRKKDQKTKGTPPAFESKFEFNGKLNIYITKTSDGSDIPPLTFDLFRLNKKREISVEDIMRKCNLQVEFLGVSKIFFISGRNGALQIVNDSDCTVLIGRDLLIKKRSHLLEYGEKIHITCEDDSEMEFHYKSVKPSEQSLTADRAIQYAD